MAKNYTFAEAVKIINVGTDMEAITDIGRRYPVLLHKVTKITAKAGEEFVDLMNFMPDYLTANKVNTALKNAADNTAEDSEEVETPSDVAEVEETEEAEAPTSGAPDYESMSGKELWDILGKAGLRKTAKSTKKADLVEACKAMDAAKAGATEAEVVEETEAEEATEANPYEGKSAMDLFKECKKRGIKAAPKKPAKFYAELLIKADAEAAQESEPESESDDWDEEEKPEPKAKAPKAEKKAPKKAAKKEETNDDDDDWDI